MNIYFFFFPSVVSWFDGVNTAARLFPLFSVLQCCGSSACVGMVPDFLQNPQLLQYLQQGLKKAAWCARI